MKYYKLGNTKEDSVFEIEILRGNVNGTNVLVTNSTVWKGAEFNVGVPSTRAEAKLYVKSMGYETMDEMMSDYGVTTLFDVIMPSENIDCLKLNDLYKCDVADIYGDVKNSYSIELESGDASQLSAVEEYLKDNFFDFLTHSGTETMSHTYHIEGGIFYNDLNP